MTADGSAGAVAVTLGGSSAGSSDAAPPEPAVSFRRRLLNILMLSLCWSCASASVFLQLSTTTAAVADFAGSKIATVPVGIMMLAATVAAPAGAVLAKRYGRRPVLLGPGLASIGAAALMAGGAQIQAVWLLCLGIAIQGVSFAQAQSLRFIAVEFSTVGFRPHALSLVVLGALLATVLGPELAKHARTALPQEYVGSYLVLLSINVLYSAVLACVQFGLLPVIARQQEREAADAADAAAAAAPGRRPPAGLRGGGGHVRAVVRGHGRDHGCLAPAHQGARLQL